MIQAFLILEKYIPKNRKNYRIVVQKTDIDAAKNAFKKVVLI